MNKSILLQHPEICAKLLYARASKSTLTRMSAAALDVWVGAQVIELGGSEVDMAAVKLALHKLICDEAIPPDTERAHPEGRMYR